MTINFERAALLLHVVDVVRNYPKLEKVHREALSELERMCEEPKPVQPVPKVEPDKASKVEDEIKKPVVKVDPIEPSPAFTNQSQEPVERKV